MADSSDKLSSDSSEQRELSDKLPDKLLEHQEEMMSQATRRQEEIMS